MKHIDDIKNFTKVLVGSERFHLMIVSGPAGWGKSYTARTVLSELKIPYEVLGSYSTPLALYNKLAEQPEQTMLIDDTAGLFYNPLALSILNSASWPSTGGSRKRHVRWTSTSERAAMEHFDFEGKLIVLTNFLPETPPVKALANRALSYEIKINPDHLKSLLLDAARSKTHFKNTKVAVAVANFLASQNNLVDMSKISLRTLEQGYEFAEVHPKGWQELLVKLLPKSEESKFSDEQIVKDLASSGTKIEEQAQRFVQLTGKSRRTFFYTRDKAGLRIRRRH